MSRTSYTFTVKRRGNRTTIECNCKGPAGRNETQQMTAEHYGEWKAHVTSNGHTVTEL